MAAKSKPKSCRHRRAWPTIYRLAQAGFLWCPDCGAVRGIRCVAPNGSVPYEKRWRVPGKWKPEDEMRENDRA